MTKYPYTALLILDVGNSVTLRQAYASAVTALATGRAEAKLIFKKRAEVHKVELLVLEYRRSPIFAESINRKPAPLAPRGGIRNEFRPTRTTNDPGSPTVL